MATKKKNMIAAGVLPLLLIVGLSCMMPFVYAIIDDRSMMEIISGQYLGHPDAHAIFIQYWYSLILTFLYRICKQIDWYALSFFIVQWICMVLILYRILEKSENKKEKMLKLVLSMTVFWIIGLQTLTQITFTTTAAVLGATVLYWYGTVDKIGKIDLVIFTMLCFLTMQIREEIFFMILPAGVIFGIIRMWRKKRWEKTELYFPVLVLLVLASGFLGEQVGYGSTEWKAYNTYNQYRSDIYDYPDYTFPPYEESKKLYSAAGIDSKARARTLMNYNYTADNQIAPDFFKRYIQIHKEIYPSVQNRIEKILDSTKTYIKGLITARFHLFQSAGMFFLIVFLIVSSLKKYWSQVAELMALIGVQTVLWTYLLYKGRVPERVIYSMNLLLVVIMFFVFREINVFLNQKQLKKIWYKGMTVIVFLLIFIGGIYGKKIRGQNLEIYDRNESVEDLKEYCIKHPENFYFNDVTTMAFTTWNVKLWRNETYTMNYMSLGDWMSFSPLWKEKLEQQGITSVREALYQWDNVYLICTFDKGLEYLTSLYENTTCTEVDHAGLFHIYKLQSL